MNRSRYEFKISGMAVLLYGIPGLILFYQGKVLGAAVVLFLFDLATMLANVLLLVRDYLNDKEMERVLKRE